MPYFVSGFTAIVLHLILPSNMEITEDDDEASSEGYQPIHQQNEDSEGYENVD